MDLNLMFIILEMKMLLFYHYLFMMILYNVNYYLLNTLEPFNNGGILNIYIGLGSL